MAQVYQQVGTDEDGVPIFEFVDTPDGPVDDSYHVDFSTHQGVGVTTPVDGPPTESEVQPTTPAPPVVYGPPTESGVQPTQPVAPVVTPPSTLDAWQEKLKSVATALNLTKPDGSYDWSKLLGMGAAGLTLYNAVTQAPDAPPKTATQLLAGLPSNTPAGFSPEALAMMQVPLKAGNQLQGVYAADMPSPIRPGVQGYAEGGEVDGPLSQTFDSSQFVGYVGAGEGGGQDDMIDARLSPGEYVFDAESVSMLGDGDNAAGARKLDELRETMRAHKRSAPNDEIAPRALGPLSYMNGGLNG